MRWFENSVGDEGLNKKQEEYENMIAMLKAKYPDDFPSKEELKEESKDGQRNIFHFYTWILSDYMAHDITKEFW